jgi:hypothetical protein
MARIAAESDDARRALAGQKGPPLNLKGPLAFRRDGKGPVPIAERNRNISVI